MIINLWGLNCSSVTEVKEYNNHYYARTIGTLTYLEAKKFAEDNGGYLAIPNNSDENNFLKSLIPTPKYAWIGIYDSDYMSNYCYVGDSCSYNDDRFVDVKGNSLSYTNWATNQPDNLVKAYDIYNGIQQVSPLGEHWVAMSSLDGKWADFGNHKDEYNNPIKYYALIEFDGIPECYTPPSDVNDTSYEEPQCNTQIWDDKTGTLENGTTYKCLQDSSNTWYCPAGLAECGDSWSYVDGYSESYSNNFVEVEEKIPECPNRTILRDGKCIYDKNNDNKIDDKDKTLISVDSWSYIQKQNGQFYKYTEKYLNYSVKMKISWGGDDYHFGAKIKNNNSLVWSRVVFPIVPSCWGSDCYCSNYRIADGGISDVNWQKNVNEIIMDYTITCNDVTGIGTGDFSITNTSAMTSRTDWKSESNLANVEGDYFFIFFRDGGSSVSNDWIKIDFLTNNIIPPFEKAEPINPIWCPDGYIDDGEHLCYIKPTYICSNNYSDNGDNCIKDITYTYYKYLCSGVNEYGESYEPIDNGGDCNPESEDDLIDTDGDGVPDSCNSPTPPDNNCKAKIFTCVSAPDRKCVYVDNKWQCSPFPCFGEIDGDIKVEDDDTPAGVNDADNNGWDENGNCNGTLYIFNGKDYRCRDDDLAGGLDGGGCCNKDKVLFGLLPCKNDEILLSKMRNAEKCHYVGEYCSKKIKLGFNTICAQHKKTYCCFNSKLARLINEQGREQLKRDWGSADSPDCRGFKPEDFQKLDLSKMDLSEFYNDITNNLSSSVQDNLNTYIKNSIQNTLNQGQ